MEEFAGVETHFNLVGTLWPPGFNIGLKNHQVSIKDIFLVRKDNDESDVLTTGKAKAVVTSAPTIKVE